MPCVGFFISAGDKFIALGFRHGNPVARNIFLSNNQTKIAAIIDWTRRLILIDLSCFALCGLFATANKLNALFKHDQPTQLDKEELTNSIFGWLKCNFYL